MGNSFRLALLIVLGVTVQPAAAADEIIVEQQVQLPPPPPLVPDRQRPRQPIFPIPRPSEPRHVLPLGPQPANMPPIPIVDCGIRRLPVNPNIDPKFVIPVPEGGPTFTIRKIAPPIPCP
jgi:hypothetical protein